MINVKGEGMGDGRPNRDPDRVVQGGTVRFYCRVCGDWSSSVEGFEEHLAYCRGKRCCTS